MIGYKVAAADNNRVIITLEIPADAKTNLYRSNIVDPQTAKYRTNKAIILKIEGNRGKEYLSASSIFSGDVKIRYNVGEVVETNFDRNIDKVCSTGIHFFLDKDVARNYGLEKIENGIIISYHDNGSIEKEESYLNGELYRKNLYWYMDINLNGICYSWNKMVTNWEMTRNKMGKLPKIFQAWDK